jgi:DMSO/TMAO reductase YedYZ molybdopterin-dependent catalytic subunit
LEPEVLEFPLETLNGPITPNELFFVRNHYPAPVLDAESWGLTIEGLVERPTRFDLKDLKRMPTVSLQATLECAGNGRAGLDPPVPGVQWACGAVSNAVWSGVPVRHVLETVGLDRSAVEIVFEGADRGLVHASPKPCGKVPFARSLPLEAALSDGPILAYEMNGEPLPTAHGAPVRLIVPGWYAVASVKWLVRMIAVDQPFRGFYQTTDYTTWEARDGSPQMVTIGPMPVKSVIARPVGGAKFQTGETVEVSGTAWAGLEEVVGVEVSADGGSTWNDAVLIGDHVPFAWRHWSFEWQVQGPTGMRMLLARATDSAGRVQPMERDWNHGTYVIDHSLPVTVMVGRSG